MTDSQKKRIKVLEYSLTLELMSSFSLAYLLDIDFDKIKLSKSLGSNSTSLSFNQKVNLLLDNKSINKEEKLKLESFMNIRNQFMHSMDANSYSNAVDNISGLKNRLKKIYPDFFIDSDIESSLESCVAELFGDSLNILTDFKGGREKKMTIQAERDIYTKRYKILDRVMKSELDRVYEIIKTTKTKSIKIEKLMVMIGLLKYEILVKANQDYAKEK